MKKLLAIALILISTSAYSAEIGKPAPEFKVNDIEGKEQSIAQYKGKTIVLEWNNPGCPYVKKFYGSNTMQKYQADAKADGVVWLTINSGAEGKQGYMTDEEAKKQVADWKAAPAAYIRDVDGKIGRAYGATSTPHMFVVDKEGVLVYQGAIDDKPSAKQEDIATAKNYVLAALASLKEGKPVETASTQSYGCGVKYSE